MTREPSSALSTSRNHGIDVLRGLAIILVILNHVGIRIPLKRTLLVEVLPAHFLSSLNYNGYEAVMVFFVISGFLITGNALRRWGSLASINVRAFYARRFARIAPCLVGLLALLSVLHLGGVADYVIHRPGQSLPRALLAALGLHLNWYEGMTGYLPGNWDVLWSLSIEELFYLGFPCVCLLTRRLWILLPLLVVLALSMPWTHAALRNNEIWQEKAYLPGMSAIAIGVIGALLVHHFSLPSRRKASGLLIIGACGVLLEMFAGRWLWPLLGDSILLLLTLSTMLLLIASQARPIRLRRGAAWVASCGRLSYEIYLSHMFVVYSAVRVYHLFGSQLRWGFAWYVLILPLCWLLGWIVARVFSIPCEGWLLRRWAIRARPGLRVDAAA